jgi:peroxiredoxin
VYLKDVNHIVGNIRQMGGEIYAISSQKGADKLDNLKNDLNVHFDLLSDTKCILAKKFGVTTISLFDSVAKVLRKGLNFSKVKYEEEHDNELSLPAAIILNNTGRVIYKWTHSGSYRSGFGLSMRVAPLDILKVASFYFSNPTIVDSISSYVKENQEQVFETVFTNEKLCQLLVNHLKREFNVEAYEFLKDVQGFDGLVKTDRNSNKLKYECNRIYETFVSEKAPKEVNITASIRSDVRSKLNKYDETYGVAFKHVKNDMKQDTFGRFVCTKEFFDVAAEVIPQILAKDA